MTRRLPPGEAAFRKRELTYKRAALDRLLEWELTQSQFRNLLTGHCNYCGSPPTNTVSPGGKTPEVSGYIVVNGIDRLDNDAGYTPANSVSCCAICNRAKRDLPLRDFEAWIDRLVARRS